MDQELGPYQRQVKNKMEIKICNFIPVHHTESPGGKDTWNSYFMRCFL